jgi:hypothetical protein
MTSFPESTVEQAALDWFGSLGYRVLLDTAWRQDSVTT